MKGFSVYHLPDVAEVAGRWALGHTGGPNHHILAKVKYLGRAGIKTAETAGKAALTHAHGLAAGAHGVLTVHAVWPIGTYSNAPSFWEDQNQITRGLVRSARRVVCLSEYTAREVYLLTGVRSTVIPQAYDPEEWENVGPGDWRNRLSIPLDAPMVFWHKTCCDPLRDPTPALLAARALPGFFFVLPVTGDELRKMWLEPIPPNVRTVGPQTFPNVQALLAASDVYLATTLESSGQGQLEAMALGKPVVGWDWGGVAETVRDGVDGFLVPYGDQGELCDMLAVAYLKRVSMGDAAAVQVKQYAWPLVVSRLINVYREAME